MSHMVRMVIGVFIFIAAALSVVVVLILRRSD